MRRIWGCVMLFFLVGCTPHTPTPVPLPVEPPAAYLEQRGEGDAGVSMERWWLAFHDESLNRMMETLFQQNLELAQALARLDQVEALVRINRGAQRPSLAVGASAGRSQQPGLVGDLIADSEQVSLAAGFELDLWGKLAARTRAAQRDFEATQDDLQTLYLGLSARLADLYFLAVEQRAKLTLNDQLVASFDDTAGRVERRYRLGLAPAIDMYQSRQSLTAARAIRQVNEARLAEVEHAISVLLGRYPEALREGAPVSLPAAPELFAVGIPADLISNRPDLRAALKRVAAADERVAAAIADRFPSINLSGGFGTLRQDVTAGLITGEFWNLLGSIALPVVDGGRRRAEVDRQQAALREALAAYQQAVLNAFREVEDALVNNAATARRVDQLDATAAATGATLRLSTDRYLAGLADYLPVLTAQRADFETRSNLISAQRQLLTDRISLARSLGGGWMREAMNMRQSMEKGEHP